MFIKSKMVLCQNYYLVFNIFGNIKVQDIILSKHMFPVLCINNKILVFHQQYMINENEHFIAKCNKNK